MRRATLDRPSGLTLVEVLVVIIIIGILVGLLIPAVQMARTSAARSICQNNFKQIGVALQIFHDTHGGLPPYGFDFSEPPPANLYGRRVRGHSAFTVILPFLEQENVVGLADLNRSSIDPVNLPPPLGTCSAGSTQIKTYLCPSAPQRDADYWPYFRRFLPFFPGFLPEPGPVILGPTDYAVIKGISGRFATQCCPAGTPSGDTGAMGVLSRNTKLTEITDGTSHTILVVEDAGRQTNYIRSMAVADSYLVNAAWADYETVVRVQGFSQDGVVRKGGCCVVNCNNNDEIYSFHPGGSNALLADGAVRFLQQDIAAEIVAALISSSGSDISLID